MMPSPWYLAAILALGAQRIGEILYARRTARILHSRGAVAIRPDGMAGIVAVHCLFFVGVVAESAWAPWAGTSWLILGVALFVAGEGLRLWSMTTLRWRWNTRVFVLPGTGLVRTGPYRALRHPIYFGVALELAGFAILNSLWATAACITILNVLALRRRIGIEERAWVGT